MNTTDTLKKFTQDIKIDFHSFDELDEFCKTERSVDTSFEGHIAAMLEVISLLGEYERGTQCTRQILQLR